MKKLWRNIAAVGIVAAMALGLSACELGGSGMSKMDASYYVKGLMDEIYLGKYDKDFLEFVETTENEAEEVHQDRLDSETDFFIFHFGISDDPATVSDEIRTQIRDLYEQMYSKSKYTVGEASKLEEGGYGVPIKISPIDVMKNIEEGQEDFLTSHLPASADLTQEQVDAMTEEEYAAYEADWVEYEAQYPQLMVDFLKEKVATLGYLEEKSFIMQVKSETKGDLTTWFIDDDDQSKFDEYVIYYPSYSNFSA